MTQQLADVFAVDAEAGILYLSDPGILYDDTVAVAVRPVDTDAPGLLGGAPAAQCPDPCGLLSAEDLREVAPAARFRPSPVRRVLADVDTGTAVSCRFGKRSSIVITSSSDTCRKSR